MTLVKGQEYSWVDVEITIEGKSEPLLGVTGIAYGVKRQAENVMGKGSEPIAQWVGSKQPEGCYITMLQSEYEALQKVIPKGFDVTDLPAFNITVSYAPEFGPRVTDRLIDCRILGNPKETGTDKKAMEIKMDLLVRKILYAVI